MHQESNKSDLKQSIQATKLIDIVRTILDRPSNFRNGAELDKMDEYFEHLPVFDKLKGLEKSNIYSKQILFKSMKRIVKKKDQIVFHYGKSFPSVTA